ncbi:MAG: hypothetical protein ACK4NS_13345 [Saprospiraceae bacterium]
MRHSISFFALALTLSFFSCNKENGGVFPPEEAYQIAFQNDYNELQAYIAVFLSDEDGKTLAAQWLPGSKTTEIDVPAISRDKKLDCTVVRMQVVQAPGSGVRDTSIQVDTYTQTPSGSRIQLRSLFYEKSTTLQIQFSGVSSVDSFITPDGLTFFYPQSSNNFYGQYQIQHTGRLWFRMKINGEKDWRFLVFQNVNDIAMNVPAFPPTVLPFIFAKPKDIQTPFPAGWNWRVDGMVDTAKLEFLAFGPMQPVPGNAVPILTALRVFEPIANDEFDPAPKIYNGFRVKAEGQGPAFNYYIDRFYNELPTSLPQPLFDVSSSNLADQRLAAARCIGEFDNLIFSRRFSRENLQIEWRTWHAAAVGAVVTYRLPDVPALVADRAPRLRQYAFAPGVWARAENYAGLNGYDEVLRQQFYNNNALWKPRADYLAVEKKL